VTCGDRPEAEQAGWVPVIPVAQLPPGKPVHVAAGGIDVLLYFAGDRIWAIGDRCTHQGAQLHRGRVSGPDDHPLVTCPIHGSQFRLEDGRVMRGPAAVAVPGYEARVNGETVEIRPRERA
jgi:nitrite reductase/ring-hydroxylating ferredoxin subunit